MFSKLLSLLAIAGAVQAHMHMDWPPALGGDNNPNTKGQPDVLLNYPYGCCQADYASKKWDLGPCRGHLSKLNTDEGKPVVTWKAGETVEFRLSGQKIKGTGAKFDDDSINVLGGDHYGGSCQAGVSVDGGVTFQTIGTWQGDCPHRGKGINPENQKFEVTLPSFLPSKERALFAWSWVNREQEFFMNCASVTIQGSNGQAPEPNPPTPTGQPTAKPSSSGRPKPSSALSSSKPTPTQKPSQQYTLEGCTCKCPTEGFSTSCDCVCDSVETKRHLVARKALVLHKSAMRRATASSIKDLPPMQLGFIKGCAPSTFPPKGAVELEFSNPGDFNVHEANKSEYNRAESTCANIVSFG